MSKFLDYIKIAFANISVVAVDGVNSKTEAEGVKAFMAQLQQQFLLVFAHPLLMPFRPQLLILL